jgi:hypothetical protein
MAVKELRKASVDGDSPSDDYHWTSASRPPQVIELQHIKELDKWVIGGTD